MDDPVLAGTSIRVTIPMNKSWVLSAGQLCLYPDSSPVETPPGTKSKVDRLLLKSLFARRQAKRLALGAWTEMPRMTAFFAAKPATQPCQEAGRSHART